MRKKKNTAAMMTPILFIVLEFLAMYIIAKNNDLQKTPFVRSVRSVQSAFWKFTGNVDYYFHLEDANADLAGENAVLRKEIDMLRERLLDSMAIAPSAVPLSDVSGRQTFEYIPARIIHNSYAYKNNYIVLNKGEKDGVCPDMGVITPNGVLGVVNAVSENACSVISILSNEISVSVKLEKADIFCIMSWDQKSSGGAVLVDIPPHIPVMAGDTVLTSGNSSVFPPDIPLGVVKSSKMGKRGFLEADVKLFENYRSVQFVSIARNNLKNEIDSLTGGGK